MEQAQDRDRGVVSGVSGALGGVTGGAGEVPVVLSAALPPALAAVESAGVLVVPSCAAEPAVGEDSGEHLRGLPGMRPQREAFGEAPAAEVAAAAVRKQIASKRSATRVATLTKIEEETRAVSIEQKILVLDTWKRCGLPASDFAGLVGLSPHTLSTWKRLFEAEGPAGLVPKPLGAPKGSKLPEMTKRAIRMMKDANPEWGCQRISDMLARGPGYPASAEAVSKVLRDGGYELTEAPTHPHEPPVRHFERAFPNQMWQTDLFTFVLKRQNRRVHMGLFMDDHSRFIVGYGIHGSASGQMVMEILESAIASFRAPEEVLTDNGPQYITWRGKSAFSKLCEKRGIKQIVAKPRHPQTLGKAERFWGTLWREFLQTAIFQDLADARRRVGLFIDHYNFQRPHQGLDGATPAERYFGVASEVLSSMKKRLQENALELARNGVPKEPFFLTGQIGGKPFSLHAEGERVFLLQEGGEKREVELVTPHAVGTNDDAPDCEPEALDEGLAALSAMGGEEVGDERE